MTKIITEFKNICINLSSAVVSFFQGQEKEIYFDDFPINKKYPDIIDPSKTREEKIQTERRNRNQVYMAIDYIIPWTTYYDCLSKDAYEIVENARILTQIANLKEVSMELILLSFFYTPSNVLNLFNEFHLTPQRLEENITEVSQSIPKTFLDHLRFSSKNLFINFQLKFPFLFKNSEYEIRLDPTIQLSEEVRLLLLTAAKNSVRKYKTPIIGTEILFLAFMEIEGRIWENGSILYRNIKNDINWEIFHYELLKKLHKTESILRSEIKDNQEFFGCLLQRELSDAELEKLIKKGSLALGVNIFRNEVVSRILNVDIHALLKEEVQMTIRFNRKKKTRKGIYK
jgi:hypothetical protein